MEPPDLPGPLDGPGHPELKKSSVKRINKAWAKFSAGDVSGARKALRKERDNPAGRLLGLQIDLTASPETALDGLIDLCTSHEDYAAAWVALTVAQEQTGDEDAALQSARHVSELWPDSRWAGKTAALEHDLITGRIDSARSRLADGDAQAALELAEEALKLDPENRSGRMVRAMALMELDIEMAETALKDISDDPEARLLLAKLAEERGAYSVAMQYYQSLPEDTAGREEGLARVKLEWRRQNLPAYVQEALASDELTRAGLAAVLVGLVPEAHALGGGQVPLLSDILDTPSRKEILTVVRLGLMDIDALQHQFYPDRPVSPPETRRAVNGLCTLLAVAPPIWCSDPDVTQPGCIQLESPVGGKEVADVIMVTTHGEDR